MVPKNRQASRAFVSCLALQRSPLRAMIGVRIGMLFLFNRSGRSLAMRRWWVLNFAAALSLFLAVLVILLWVRSYWRCDEVGIAEKRPTGWHVLTLKSDSGSLLLLHGDLMPRQPEPPGRSWHRVTDSQGPSKWEWMPAWGTTLKLRFVHVPYYWIAVTGLILPLVRMRAWVSDRRRGNSGFCAVCGYDLRATPGRCPESGAEPKRTSKAVAEPADAVDRAGG